MNKQELSTLLRSKIPFYISSVVLFFTLLILVLVIYWINVPKHVLSIKNNPVPVTTKETSPNTYAALLVNYCKYSDTHGDLRIRLVSDKGFISSMVLTTDATKEGCQDNFPVPLIVPGNTAPGIYHFEFFITYKINPIRTETSEFHTQDFVVK